jgi:hypothetical protein
MLEMVAVGAVAKAFEFRIPCRRFFSELIPGKSLGTGNEKWNGWTVPELKSVGVEGHAATGLVNEIKLERPFLDILLEDS